MWEVIKNLDLENWIDIINCVIAFAALFVGGSAHKKINKYTKSFNDKKKFGDNGVDNSKKSAGDMIVYEFDPNVLAQITALNFETSLKAAYEAFDKKSTQNLHDIFEKSKKYIADNKIDLKGYTKIDWINLYFENAKNTNNQFMQEIWAKVLAKELAVPDSFSFKTLDILKNMREEDFHLFEKMCSISPLDGYILQGKIVEKHLDWVEHLRLRELELINLDSTTHWQLALKRVKSIPYFKSKDFVLLIDNETDEDIKVEISIYCISSAARELMAIADYTEVKEYFIDFGNEIKSKYGTKLHIHLHEIINKVKDKKDLLDMENKEA
ncbi:MAG: DUF2806 domain-containing protein [Clostridia bacterium]|nr:DUF2806 domain-containing protein [Clostridia bacterium]